MKIFRRRERDLDDEIASHLRMAAEDSDAATARREFGSIAMVKETTRRMWGWTWIATWVADFRFGLRIMRRSPVMSAICILTLGFGMALTLTFFCWVEAVAGKSLPGARAPERLVEILPSYGGSVHSSAMALPDFRDLSGIARVFDGAFASIYTSCLMRFGEQNDWLDGRLVSANAFDVLGVRVERGRAFVADEDRGEGAHPVLLISHDLWQRRFGGAENIAGTRVEMNRHSFLIVGVLPRGFSGLGGGLRTDFWAPLTMHNEILNYGSFESHTFRWVGMMARLSAGVGVATAQSAVDILSRQLAKAYPESNRGLRYTVVRLAQSPNRDLAALLPALRVLFAVAAGVLVIVVLNVANLLLVRATSRGAEMAVRLAIGAARSRLIRQVLTESVLLGTGGAVLGVGLASRALRLLWFFAPETSRHFDYSLAITPRAVTFAILLVFGVTLMLGLAPALLATATDLNASLKSGGRGMQPGSAGQRIRKILVIAEVALTMLLLVGAGLTLQGFRRARAIELGFDPSHVLCAHLPLTASGYSAPQGRIFDRQLRDRVAALPGVKDVALASLIPLSLGNFFSAPVEVEGHVAGPNEDRLASFFMVSGGFFSTIRQPILEGSDFTSLDEQLPLNVAIVNQAMARRFWPAASPVGRRFRMAVGVAPVDTFTVIVVVASTKYRSLADAPEPVVYLNYLQRPLASLFMNLVIRTEPEPQSVVAALRREVHALDPSVEPSGIATMEEYIRPAYEPARVAATVLASLGLTALLLASVGLYGVMAYLVSMRAREIGVRMALGASPGEVFQFILGHGLRLAALGMLAGSAAALALTHLLASFLYGVSATDARVFIGAAALIAVMAALACTLPARRALRVDVTATLREY